jgi:hypothetical protein
MLYAVRVKLSAEQWERAVEECRQALPHYQDDIIEQLPSAKLHEIYLTVMRQALRRHHEWLAKRDFIAVISRDGFTDGCTFVFYFDNKREAASFKWEFVDRPARGRKKAEKEAE